MTEISDIFKENLFGLTPERLKALCSGYGMPPYTGGQICEWLYRKNANDINEMSNISLTNRDILKRDLNMGLEPPVRTEESSDGTKKYLFPTRSGAFIESAYIPDKDRATLCVSSQAGCRLGCVFCMTGRQGLQHNLTAGEIINQVRSLPERESLTNIVYMGMGEPLDNTEQVLDSLRIMTSKWGYGWSPSRITLSTAGIIPGLEKFLNESSVNLAVSLHNPFPDQRAELMPIEKAYPMSEVVRTIRRHPGTGKRKISFEYILLEGFNNSFSHIKELTRLLNGLNCNINLIRFHKIPGSPFFSPPQEKIIRFRDNLTAKGFYTTIRASRGEDIRAACGLLSTEVNSGQK